MRRSMDRSSACHDAPPVCFGDSLGYPTEQSPISTVTSPLEAAEAVDAVLTREALHNPHGRPHSGFCCLAAPTSRCLNLKLGPCHPKVELTSANRNRLTMTLSISLDYHYCIFAGSSVKRQRERSLPGQPLDILTPVIILRRG